MRTEAVSSKFQAAGRNPGSGTSHRELRSSRKVGQMPPLLRASASDFILNPIVEVATEFIGSAGELGVFALMVLESACIPVPSEAIMLFAGFSVSEGEMTLFGI